VPLDELPFDRDDFLNRRFLIAQIALHGGLDTPVYGSDRPTAHQMRAPRAHGVRSDRSSVTIGIGTFVNSVWSQWEAVRYPEIRKKRRAGALASCVSSVAIAWPAAARAGSIQVHQREVPIPRR
jgi:hypothetical protein